LVLFVFNVIVKTIKGFKKRREKMKECLVFSKCGYCQNWNNNKVVGEGERYVQFLCNRCLRVYTCEQATQRFFKKEVPNDYSGSKTYGPFGPTPYLFNVNQKGR
jgi:hypothetical protein